MSTYLGDFAAGATVYCSFNTRDTDGAPITLAGTPAISVYKNADDTEDTSGVTLAVDDDSRTGWHRVSIDTSQDGTFFAAGNDFFVVITAGTVDAVSVVGVVVAHFSIANRPVQNLAAGVITATAIATGAIDADAIADNAIDAGAIASDAITAAKIANGAIDAATFAADVDAEARSWLGMAAADLDTQLDAIVEDTGEIGAAGAGLTALATQASVNTVDGNVDLILADTGTDGVVVAAGSKTGYALTSAYDFAKGTTAVTESYAANGAAPTPVEAIMAIHQMLMQFAISGTTLTVKKLDNSTTAFEVTLDDDTSPSSAVRA